jgi:hypothetical protein
MQVPGWEMSHVPEIIEGGFRIFCKSQLNVEFEMAILGSVRDVAAGRRGLSENPRGNKEVADG